MYLQLPAELWLLIFRAIVCQGRWRDLLHLSWTCRIAHAAAKPFVWHTLTLVIGPERPPAHSLSADRALQLEHPQLQRLATVAVDPACALVGNACRLPHLILNGRLFLVDAESRGDDVRPVVLHPWPAQWTRRVIVHDHLDLCGSPDMQSIVTQLLKSLSACLGNRIQSVQVVSNGGRLFDALYPCASSSIRLPQALPIPFTVHESLSPVSHSVILFSSGPTQSPALRHLFPSLVRVISDLQLHGSFDFIVSEWHGWLPSITRLFSNPILTSLTLHLCLPLKNWTLHQSHQFPIDMPALASLSLSFDAATALFSQVDQSSRHKVCLFPSLKYLDLSDQFVKDKSGESFRMPYIPFKHMPNLSHVHVRKLQPTASHALHINHVMGLAHCPKLASLRFPAVHYVSTADWIPPSDNHVAQVDEHRHLKYPSIPSVRELEVGELAPQTQQVAIHEASSALLPFSWTPSIAKATRLVYYCHGDCSLPSLDDVNIDSGIVLYPKLAWLAIHAPSGSVSAVFFRRLAIAAPNLVTLCVFANSLVSRRDEQLEGWEHVHVPATLRLLALYLGEVECDSEVQGLGERLGLPELCKVKIQVRRGVGVGKSASCK